MPQETTQSEQRERAGFLKKWKERRFPDKRENKSRRLTERAAAVFASLREKFKGNNQAVLERIANGNMPENGIRPQRPLEIHTLVENAERTGELARQYIEAYVITMDEVVRKQKLKDQTEFGLPTLSIYNNPEFIRYFEEYCQENPLMVNRIEYGMQEIQGNRMRKTEEQEVDIRYIHTGIEMNLQQAISEFDFRKYHPQLVQEYQNEMFYSQYPLTDFTTGEVHAVPHIASDPEFINMNLNHNIPVHTQGLLDLYIEFKKRHPEKAHRYHVENTIQRLHQQLEFDKEPRRKAA